MKKHLSVLKKCTLFKDFIGEDMLPLLDILGTQEKSYRKNQMIFGVGDVVDSIGVVAEGAVHLEKTDIDGSRNIIIEVHSGQTFGETLAFACVEKSPIDIVAASDCTIIFLPVSKIIETCLQNNRFSTPLIKNTSQFVAQKSMILHIKNDILAQKSIRAKLLSYLYYESNGMQVEEIEIPFSRENLADFLSVNPSALSREMGNMRDDGLLTFKRNRFVLNQLDN